MRGFRVAGEAALAPIGQGNEWVVLGFDAGA